MATCAVVAVYDAPPMLVAVRRTGKSASALLQPGATVAMREKTTHPQQTKRPTGRGGEQPWPAQLKGARAECRRARGRQTCTHSRAASEARLRGSPLRFTKRHGAMQRDASVSCGTLRPRQLA